jgi:hypothetical protein
MHLLPVFACLCLLLKILTIAHNLAPLTQLNIIIPNYAQILDFLWCWGNLQYRYRWNHKFVWQQYHYGACCWELNVTFFILHGGGRVPWHLGHKWLLYQSQMTHFVQWELGGPKYSQPLSNTNPTWTQWWTTTWTMVWPSVIR